jgi:ABC-type antimicrobial peptide transport system permease subunit
MALGARPVDITRQGLRDGGRLAMVGIAIGLGLGLAATRVVGARVTPGEPIASDAVIAALVIVTAATLLACYLPARRASRIDPVATLRRE